MTQLHRNRNIQEFYTLELRLFTCNLTQILCTKFDKLVQLLCLEFFHGVNPAMLYSRINSVTVAK